MDTAGTYTIAVSGADSTSGAFTAQVTLNAALEAEGNGGPTNDTLGTAQDLDGSAVSLGGSATRIAVIGTGASSGSGVLVASENFESGSLPSSISTYSSNVFGQIRVTTPGGTGNSSAFALLMESSRDADRNPVYALNEAVYTVNLTAAPQTTLSFSHINFSDEAEALPADFTGHFNGDGVAISANGINLAHLSSAREQTPVGRVSASTLQPLPPRQG